MDMDGRESFVLWNSCDSIKVERNPGAYIPLLLFLMGSSTFRRSWKRVSRSGRRGFLRYRWDEEPGNSFLKCILLVKATSSVIENAMIDPKMAAQESHFIFQILNLKTARERARDISIKLKAWQRFHPSVCKVDLSSLSSSPLLTVNGSSSFRDTRDE